MRFTYFDPTGNEVPVATVEALAFRIRTGLVTEETLLYDAAVDRWMPAGEHRLFRFVKEEGEGPWSPDELAAPPASPGPSDPAGASDGEEGTTEDGDDVGTCPPADERPGDPRPAEVGRRSPGPRPDPSVREESSSVDRPRPGRATASGEGLSGGEGPVSGGEAGAPFLSDQGSREGEQAPSGEGASPSERSSGTRRRLRSVLLLSLFLVAVAVATRGIGFAVGGGEESQIPSPVHPSEAGPAEGMAAGAAPEERLTASTVAEAADRAFAGAAIDLQLALGVSDAPPRVWLQGRYLAGASRFPEVGRFWDRLEVFLSSLRLLEEELHRGYVDRRLLAAGLDPSSARSISREALNRLRELREDRAERYELLVELAGEARELHDLLVRGEEAIRFEPFWGRALSRDPVVEAVPDDTALAEEMWAHLDRVFELLESLDEEGRASTLRVHRALLLEGAEEMKSQDLTREPPLPAW